MHINQFLFLIEKLCKQDLPRKSCGESTCYDCTDSAHIEESLRRRGASNKGPKKTSKPLTHSCRDTWRPLVLFVPLRLGLSEMNPVYNDSLKVSVQNFDARIITNSRKYDHGTPILKSCDGSQLRVSYISEMLL
jgi:hypothetical protein